MFSQNQSIKADRDKEEQGEHIIMAASTQPCRNSRKTLTKVQDVKVSRGRVPCREQEKKKKKSESKISAQSNFVQAQEVRCIKYELTM